PFSFEEERRGEVVERLDRSPRWTERHFSLARDDDVDRTEYFLPYIRRFLFPTLFEPRGARACWQYVFDLRLLGALTADGLPLALHGSGAAPHVAGTINVWLERVELIVFGYRVGFLVLRTRCRDEAATYFDQMRVLTLLRSFVPPYRGFARPELEVGASRFRMTQLLPFLLAEFGAARPESVVEVPADAALPVKPTYDDRMMVYAFSCLDDTTALEDVEQCDRLLGQHAILNFDRKATQSPDGPKRPRDVAAWM